ncbi:MAG: hypothetical protein AAB316_16885 [Bacteroidota bacterium]
MDFSLPYQWLLLSKRFYIGFKRATRDEERYTDRCVVEHANAWMDACKALLVRFETTVRN